VDERMKHLHIKVFGRVQGVGFRYSAKKEADNLGILGYARNEDDGSVFIEAQGAEKELEQFLAWCRRGPWLAKVERVEHAEKEPSKKFEEFSVR
jgi:acylphosphatase